MKILSGLISIVLMLSSSAHASAEVLFSRNKSAPTWNGLQSYGLEIVADTWSDSDPQFADQTYKAFKGYQTSRKVPMGKYDYYYRLKVVTPTSLRATTAACSPYFQTLAQAILGTSKAALVLVNAAISYEPAIGEVMPLIGSGTPLLMYSSGAAAGALTPGNGCYLKETVAVEFPVIQFEDNDKEAFQVNFDVTTGQKLTSNLVTNLLALFTSANTAFAWNAITAGQQGLVTTASQQFENALNTADTFQSESPIMYELGQKKVMYVALPYAYKQHVVEMFPYVSASIILSPNRTLTPSDILINNNLETRTCSLTDVISAKCSLVTSARMSILGGKYVTNELPSGYTLPISIFDPEGRPELVDKLCQNLRDELRETLRLSTIDQILVRWAFTKNQSCKIFSPIPL